LSFAKKIIAATLSIGLLAQPLTLDWPAMAVVWNVAQGQWTTIARATECEHFDMGGEVTPRGDPVKLCFGRLNRLWVSHGDWDHIGFIGKYQSRLTGLCLGQPVTGRLSLRKQILLRRLPACGGVLSKEILRNLWSPPPGSKTMASNDASHVFAWRGMLFPGDAPARSERNWRNLATPLNIRILFAGHHGSRTSTSRELLHSLPYLHQAIASARRAKYGHPHAETAKRLNDQGIPLLSTEVWGNIRLDL
jgi:competence protein ComEC